MPFRSEAQRRKFYAMADRGEISAKTVQEWERETPKNQTLPERVKKAAYTLGMRRAFDTLNITPGASNGNQSTT